MLSNRMEHQNNWLAGSTGAIIGLFASLKMFFLQAQFAPKEALMKFILSCMFAMGTAIAALIGKEIHTHFIKPAFIPLIKRWGNKLRYKFRIKRK